MDTAAQNGKEVENIARGCGQKTKQSKTHTANGDKNAAEPENCGKAAERTNKCGCYKEHSHKPQGGFWKGDCLCKKGKFSRDGCKGKPKIQKHRKGQNMLEKSACKGLIMSFKTA